MTGHMERDQLHDDVSQMYEAYEIKSSWSSDKIVGTPHLEKREVSDSNFARRDLLGPS